MFRPLELFIGLRYVRAVPPAVPEGPRLVWTLGRLPPGQEHTVQAFFQAQAPGTVTSVATVETEEGLRDQASATTSGSATAPSKSPSRSAGEQ